MSEITPEKAATRVPADYYSAPVAETDRLFPRWVPFGCGTAALIILILMFLGGAFISQGGGTRAIHWFFGKMQTELLAICDRDVQPAQKSAFTAEMSALQARIASGKVKSDNLMSVFEAIRDDTADNRVSASELEQLTKKIHEINTAK